MTQYNVTGMSCAACVARVEKAVSKIDGVNSCSVSLLTNSMNVDGSAEKIARCRGFSQRYRNTQNQKKTYRMAHCPCSVDVFFNGTYDVGMAVAVIF